MAPKPATNRILVEAQSCLLAAEADFLTVFGWFPVVLQWAHPDTDRIRWKNPISEVLYSQDDAVLIQKKWNALNEKAQP